jgi:predicted anti-sigma-YlaC factor YlaD
MEMKHIGVVRLHDLVTSRAQFSYPEIEHLHECPGCREVFTAFTRQMAGSNESLSAPAAKLITEDCDVVSDCSSVPD